MKIRILSSAFKHGVSELQIREVLACLHTTKEYEIHEDVYGNPQMMLVGYTQSGVLLEIGVRYTDESDDVFHANRASIKYRRLYKKE